MAETPEPTAERLLAALAAAPVATGPIMTDCLAHLDEIAPVLRGLLTRAAAGDALDVPEQDLLFAGLHLLAAGGEESAFPDLLRLLRRPADEVRLLLGDAVTITLTRLAIGLFDGDAEALIEACTDPAIGSFARGSLIGALTQLTWTGRIDRARTREFLERFETERLVAADDKSWVDWALAIGLLGFRDLAPRVEAAFENDRGIKGSFPGPEDFRRILANAEARPDDPGQFAAERWMPIADVATVLDGVMLRADEAGTVEDDTALLPDDEAFWNPQVPVTNPLRHVGRNDPCPCGSGKKYKKCCLP